MAHKVLNLSRRQVGLGLVAIPLVAGCSSSPDPLTDWIVMQEQTLGARIGFAAFDMKKWQALTHRADERFALCSTFKWVLAGLVLEKVQNRELDMDKLVAYTRDDLVPYAPVMSANLESGAMSVSALCEAAVSVSDNGAANLLLRLIGGPDGFTQGLGAFGDQTTRLDRFEPELNENAPGDPRDTTTPSAMIDLMGAMLFDGRERLDSASRKTLRDWMINASTGQNRLRAGMPEGWVAGDKTGTSVNGAFNDVAFVFPEATDTPILMASYINVPQKDGVSVDASKVDAIHADLARKTIERFAL